MLQNSALRVSTASINRGRPAVIVKVSILPLMYNKNCSLHLLPLGQLCHPFLMNDLRPIVNAFLKNLADFITPFALIIVLNLRLQLNFGEENHRGCCLVTGACQLVT